MPLAIKLTNENMQTHGGYQFTLGETHKIEGRIKLCENGFHCYPQSVALALFMNPKHGNFRKPRAFLAEVGGDCDLSPTKWAYAEMTLIEELKIPKVTTTQRVAFGILCALEAYKEPNYVTWANNWLSGVDRTNETANAAAYAAYIADAAYIAAYAANAAAYAAETAAYAAYADYATYAANAAADAADYAAASADIDLIALSEKALTY
jgi:hypothetical protein